MERRFEEILRDPSWGEAARMLAEGILDRCAIEKALYSMGRKGDFAGIRAIASMFQAFYQQQASLADNPMQSYTANVPEVLGCFSNICRPILRATGEMPVANRFKEQATEKLKDFCQKTNWLEKPACEAAQTLLHEFLIADARRILEIPLLKAQQRGHGSYQQLAANLEAVLFQLRLEPLMEAILEGHEKFPNKPRCKREEIKKTLDDSLLG